MTIKAQIENILNEVVTAEYTLKNPPKYEMRCSTLSKFCQIAFLISKIENDLEREYFTKDFYCSVGTAVHSVLQKWLGIKHYLYGLWECPICNKIQEGFGPKHCDNTLCIYKEYELSWKGMSGHCDGLILLNNQFYILEFKTISLKSLQERRKQNKPFFFHSNQVNMYVLMGQKLKLPKPLIGGIIIYIARDNPKHFLVFVQSGVDLESINNVITLYQDVEIRNKTGNFKGIVKACSNLQDAQYCPYKSLCFKGDVELYLKNLWALYHGKK